MNEERYNVAGKIYAGERNFVPQAISGEYTLAACAPQKALALWANTI